MQRPRDVEELGTEQPRGTGTASEEEMVNCRNDGIEFPSMPEERQERYTKWNLALSQIKN